jgi:hypothetical protein
VWCAWEIALGHSADFLGGREIKEEGVILTWEGEQASALDQTSISTSRKIAAIHTRDNAGNDIAHDVMFAFAFHAPLARWDLDVGKLAKASGNRFISPYSRFVPITDWRLSQKGLCVNFGLRNDHG